MSLETQAAIVAAQFDYRAGASGSPRSFVGRVLGITAHSTAGGSMTINGGDSIPIPANAAVEFRPAGQLVSPALVFTNTDSYIVELAL